ncbi:MAG: hypothetical protein C0504_06200 [Candidatus Solibacter sp.]|jgi:hypothetical protein|nr:hypothetical protein [Candidatus Solibacter sp.]
MKHQLIKRKPSRRDDPLYGLNRRVARRLGKSESLISKVRHGVIASREVADAIVKEGRLLLKEWKEAQRAREADLG